MNQQANHPPMEELAEKVIKAAPYVGPLNKWAILPILTETVSRLLAAERSPERMACGHLKEDFIYVNPICPCGTHLGCIDDIEIAHCTNCDAIHKAYCRICVELAARERAGAKAARLKALTDVHEYWEFDSETEADFDKWLHDEIIKLRPPASALPAPVGGPSSPRTELQAARLDSQLLGIIDGVDAAESRREILQSVWDQWLALNCDKVDFTKWLSVIPSPYSTKWKQATAPNPATGEGNSK